MKVYKIAFFFGIVAAIGMFMLWFGPFVSTTIAAWDSIPENFRWRHDLQGQSILVGLVACMFAVGNAFYYAVTRYTNIERSHLFQAVFGATVPFALPSLVLIAGYSQGFMSEQKIHPIAGWSIWLAMVCLIILSVASCVTAWRK